MNNSLTIFSDTDGLWADEWDVDMGVYEGQVGDKDARDAREMRESDQFKRHGDVTETVGDFEKHTKVYVMPLLRTLNVHCPTGKPRLDRFREVDCLPIRYIGYTYTDFKFILTILFINCANSSITLLCNSNTFIRDLAGD